MKFKSLFAAAALAVFALVGCESEENLGEARISVDPTSISLAATDDSKAVTLVATRDWQIYSQPDWVALDKTTGTASTKEQTVTISVAANSGNDREGEVVFTIGLARASLTVKQAGEAGELKKGSGTLEDPYSVAGAIEFCQSLGADVQSENSVYIKGIVSSVSTTYEASGTYGNALFYIVDNEGDTDQFYAFQTLYLGNRKWTSGDDDIKAGDAVIICGPVVNYKGNTPETVGKGASYLYSLNGVTGGDAPTPTPGTAKGTGTLADPYNPAGAAAAVASLTWTSNTDYQKTDPVYVKGKVKSIAVSNNVEQSYANTGTYGNASFYITDSDDATGEFYVFRALYLGNKAYQSGQTDIKVGDEVVICGALMNYHGNTPETVANEAYLYSLNGVTGSDTPTPSNPSGTGTQADPYNAAGVLAFIATLEGSNESTNDVYVKGKISSIKYTFSADYGTATFDISDDGSTNGSQFTCYSVYTLGNQAWVEGNTQIAVGDEVIICGKVYKYNGNTPETVSKKAYIYSLNGKTSDTVGPVFGVEKTEITVAASATSATINVTGNVKWTASSENATVNPASGEGNGAVTVSFAANTDTENAKTYTVVVSTTEDVTTKSYTVTITQNKVSAGGEEVTVTFDKAKLAAAACKGAVVKMDDVISFTNSSDYGTTNVTELRIYKSQTFTVTATGKTITKIEFTCTASDKTKQGPGCWGAGAPSGYTYSGTNGTWVGESASVAFTATDNQVRIVELKVSYK